MRGEGANSAFARAKINLTLHVVGKRPDGYHVLESLVGFAEFGDTLRVADSEALTLTVTGPFADYSGAVEDNLVIRAAGALLQHSGIREGAALTLAKHIPVGAGLGGGSADAALTLRRLNRHWNIHASEAELFAIARALGADVGMCLRGKAAVVQGIGDEITALPHPLPEIYAVLCYPGKPLATAQVFGAYAWPQRRPQWPDFSGVLDYAALITTLATCGNDLTETAIALCPEVAQVLHAFQTLTPAPNLVRMTGSGACCFALYPSASDAQQAAERLKTNHPEWWVQASRVG